MVGIYNGLIDHRVPPNAGSFRRIEILLRENCCVGIPRHPFSCSVATTNLADRVSNPVQLALAELADGFGMAETGPIIPPAGGVISGRDPRRHDARFVNQVHLGLTGGAATPTTDGWLTIVHVGNAGMCRHDGIEVDELHHPVHISERRLLPDTEGAGRFRGALAAYVEFGPTAGCRLEVLYTSDGTINPAGGARGGGPGSQVKALKRERSGELTPCPTATASPSSPASGSSPIRRAAAATARPSSAISRGSSTTSTRAGSRPRGRPRSMASCSPLGRIDCRDRGAPRHPRRTVLSLENSLMRIARIDDLHCDAGWRTSRSSRSPPTTAWSAGRNTTKATAAPA